MGMLEGVFNLNRRITRALTPTHVHEANVFGVYRKFGALLMSHPDVHRVADCGAGAAWHFPSYYKKWYNVQLIGLDIDGAEMVDNGELDEKIECDVTKSIPVPPGSVDLVMASSGIEHFSDNRAFLDNAFAALRPGGYLLAQFPGRYAPHAILNRMLPARATKRLLAVSMKEEAEVLGFKAYYDRTHYTAFRRIAEDAGFRVTYHSPGYYSSSYAEFFLPLWVFSYLYDSVRFAFGIRDLASYNLFVLQKPDPAHGTAETEPFVLYA